MCIVVAVITLGYFLKLQRTVYQGKSGGAAEKKEAPSGMLAPMAVLALAAIFTGILLVPGIREASVDRAVDVMENFSYTDIAIGE